MKQWWREPGDADAVEPAYGPAIDGADPAELLIAELDGQPIGMLQRYLLADNPTTRGPSTAGAPRPAAGLDYLISGPDLTGRRFGPLDDRRGLGRCIICLSGRRRDVITVQ